MMDQKDQRTDRPKKLSNPSDYIFQSIFPQIRKTVFGLPNADTDSVSQMFSKPLQIPLTSFLSQILSINAFTHIRIESLAFY